MAATKKKFHMPRAVVLNHKFTNTPFIQFAKVVGLC